ncbi:kinase-like domain-containing protein [Flagelloscypha sp. PMI_526]|nr:kinase-like domain-containing protein [Flagelloscypha sp. PMI_526]
MVGGGSQTIWVNRKAYARLGMIGKGGSSRVFRVMNIANDLYAVKRVSLDKVDADTLNGYMNEIALLKRLEGNSRIIRLYDSEVRPGPGGSKGHLVLVMECGEVDFAKLLAEQQKEPLNVVWVSYYWQQMLQAVQVIHDEKIVHSDLKPANFVVVRGQLKLIDFGIANAIANDTTNIHRDHQIGTVNYMSPEAIEPDAIRRIKVGRPSDVWSLGCILYQMVYGSPPFSHLNVMQKMRAIPNPDYQIEFPEFATPSIPKGEKTPESSGEAGPAAPQKLEHLKRPVRRDVIENIKQCLKRVPKERATIPKLLEQQWIALNNGPESATAAPEQPFTSNKQPTIQDLLAPDQTVITPHYMKQLLCYAQSLNITDDNDPRLDIEAKKLVEELRQVQL